MKQSPLNWLRQNVHQPPTPILDRDEYLEKLTRNYFNALSPSAENLEDAHWQSELSAEIHLEWALDGHSDMSATEFRLFKSAYSKLADWVAQRRSNAEKGAIAA